MVINLKKAAMEKNVHYHITFTDYDTGIYSKYI